MINCHYLSLNNMANTCKTKTTKLEDTEKFDLSKKTKKNITCT